MLSPSSPVSGVAADDARLRDQVAQLVAALVGAVNHRDGNAAFVKQACQIHADPSAAHDHHIADAPPLLPDGGEKPSYLPRLSHQAELVAALQDKIAVWDQGLVTALHHADQDLGAKALRALPQAKAVEGAALRDAAVDDLGAALGKGLDPNGAGEAQDARDLLGALVFGVDHPGEADSLPQKFHLRQILRIAHAGDDVLRPETARGQRADHVGLVALGHGHEDIGPGRAAFAQRVGIGGAA